MKKCMVGVLAVFLLFLTSTVSVFAGGLNAAEARLYSAAGGTFTLEGKVYRAYGNYLAQVYDYLCQDDVDLTEEQADSKIAMMHNDGNILTAVNRGYIYQIGVVDGYTPETGENGEDTVSVGDGDGKKEDSYEYFDKTSSKDEPFYDEKSYKESEMYKKHQEEIESENKTSSEILASADAAVEKKAEQSARKFNTVLKQRPESKEKQTEIFVDEITGEITISGTTGFTAFLLKALQNNAGNYRTLLMTVSILLLVLALALAVLLFRKKCFCFQKKKKDAVHTSHGQRRKLRKTAGLILSAETALQIFIIFFCIGMQLSFFQYSRISETLTETGSYHVAYTQMMGDVHALLKKENCMEDICDEVLSYEDFLFDTKKQMQQQLAGKDTAAAYSDVIESVKEAVSQVSYISDADAAEIGNKVLEIYTDSVHSSVGSCIYSMKNRFTEVVYPGIFLVLVNLIINIGLLIAMQHYAHRGMRNIFRAVSVAAVGMGIWVLYLAIGKPFAHIFIKPDELYVFFNGYMRWAVKVFGVIFAGGAVAAILLHVASRFMRERLEED